MRSYPKHWWNCLINFAMKSKCDLQMYIGFKKNKCTMKCTYQKMDVEQDIALLWKNNQHVWLTKTYLVISSSFHPSTRY